MSVLSHLLETDVCPSIIANANQAHWELLMAWINPFAVLEACATQETSIITQYLSSLLRSIRPQSDSGTRPFMIYLIFSWVWISVHWVFHFDLIHSRCLFSRFMLFQLISISGFYRNEAFYICFSCSFILQNICQWSNFIEKLTLWCKITVIWIVKRMTLHAAFVISINSMYQSRHQV